ncbi:hypothetical protein DFH08DRAFT_795781 [Mycena albidolilacea]|uniref:Uncharacterized protein n=1 Tax=Mycena albidolilacea TaxID=1033008 RepID=A0AAD7AU60_9AGAR|nr:hypothetical protein DFH08DRAFT_795781 [Mycena albidolilacea]
MSSDSDPSPSSLSDGDALLLKHYGRDIMQDVTGAIAQSIFCMFTLINTICDTYDGPLPGGGKLCMQSSLVGWVSSIGTNITCTAAPQDDARVEFVWERVHNVNRKNPESLSAHGGEDLTKIIPG